MGRASKIQVWGIKDAIDKLHSEGYTLKAICEELNDKHKDLHLNENNVSMYLCNKTKSVSTDKETQDVLEYIQEKMNNIGYQVDRSKSINMGDRRVLKSAVSTTRNQIISKVKSIEGINVKDPYIEELNRALINFSNEISPESRKILLGEIAKVRPKYKKQLEIRKKEMDEYSANKKKYNIGC